MCIRNSRLLAACLVGSIFSLQNAQAQWAVVDAPAIIQLVQEVQTMEQQLATARDQLQQARQTWQSTTGGRGMEQLLSGTVRNYLPSTWSQMTGVLGATGGSGPLSTDVRSAVTANAVLTAQQLAAFSPSEQQWIQATRQWNAMREAISHQALANASARFASIQALIGSIATAQDQKGILDLQARIGAEVGMLQNEQTKLLVLAQATAAQESILSQQAREFAIAGQGIFRTRFQPVP